MMRQRAALLLVVVSTALVLPSVALAQPGARFEISPTLAYRSEGDVDAGGVDIFDDAVEIDEGTAVGLVVSIPLGGLFSLELLANRQETELLADDGLFTNDRAVADLDIDYYQVGMTFEFGDGQVHPFFTTSIGIASLSVDLPRSNDEDFPAATLGGGVKIFFGQHFGLRLEGRGYFVALDDDDHDHDHDDDHHHDDHDSWDNEDSITQLEASVGLIFSW